MKLGTIGGLLVLLVVAAAGCDTEPANTVVPTSPATVDHTEVEVVYASRERQPPILFPGDYDPLWADLVTDGEIIDDLLSSIVVGKPVDLRAGSSTHEVVTIRSGWGMDEEDIEVFDGRSWLSGHSLVINIAFRDGSVWSVRQVVGCDVAPEGRVDNCRPVPDHWELLHRDEVIVSTTLSEWFEHIGEYMPPVERLEFDDPIPLDELFTVTGGGFHEGNRVVLSIEMSDGSDLPLGEVVLDHGAFRWDGEISEGALSGRAHVGMQVLKDEERVWGMTRSATVIDDVEVVYTSRKLQPPFLVPGDYDPLWGDLGPDASRIEELLNAITTGTVDRFGEEDYIAYSDEGLVVNVRFSGGTTWSLKQAIECSLTPEGRTMNCVSMPNLYHWELDDPAGGNSSWVINELALTEWFARVGEYMPRVGDPFKFPDQITLGETFTISGSGYHEGDRVTLSIEFPDGSVRTLGEVALERGAYRWSGKISETSPAGPVKVTLQIRDGSGTVWSASGDATALSK